MQRARLTRIKLMANKLPTNPFDEFKNSLPKELESYKGSNYRLEAAWKAYGKPKNLNEAIWEGLVQPIGENNYKMPSIGYNEETEDYEYLNTGKENDIIAKDIRAWDNNVIPFIQELKQGGYVRTFNEEENFWTYSKNSQKEDTLDLKGNSVGLELSQQDIEFLRQGGKKEKSELIIPSFLTLDKNGNYISKYYSDDDLAEDLKWYRSKDSKAFRKQFKLNDLDWEDGTPDGKPFMYIPKKKYLELLFKKFKGLGSGMVIDSNGEVGDGMPLKPTGQYAPDGQELYESPTGELFTLKPQAFKQGGELIDSFLKGGKPKLDSKESGEEPIGYLNDGTPLYKKGDGTIGPLTKENVGKDNLFDLIKNSNANWAKRLQDPNRKYITYPDGSLGNFKLAWSKDETGTIVYPEILEIDGQLIDLSEDPEKAWKSAIEHKDYIYFPSNDAADWFTKNYKNYYKGFDKTPRAFKQGGQMSVIPEGALHARKNNMKGAGEEFTHKGIPVVDNNGEQQAEIEKEEIILSKSVTDKVEELYKKYNSEETSASKKDEIAIEMGKIITCEIMTNTDDRTGLIDKILNND